MRFLRDRPVVQGLLAMAAVTLVIAGGAGLGALVLTSAIDPGDGSGDAAATGTARPSMYLPEPSKSKKRGPGPLISPGVQPRQRAKKPKAGGASDPAGKEITLEASPKKAGSMQEVTLQGTYPGADGAILSIEKLQSGGSWISFVGVTTRVSAGEFSTTIQTGVLGENKFRAVDTDSDTTSNEVTVTIG